MLEEKKTNLSQHLSCLYDQVKVDVRKDDLILVHLLEKIDELTVEIVNEEGYHPHEQILLAGTFGKEKTMELAKLEEKMKANPAFGLMLGIDALCRNLGQKLRAELGAPALDTAYVGNLKLRIPCDDIGRIFSTFLSPDEIEAENEKVRTNLRKLGFVWDKIEEVEELKNFTPLDNYLKSAGMRHLGYELHDGKFRHVTAHLIPDKYTWFTNRKEEEAKDSKFLTKTDVYNIQKAIRDYHHALGFYEMMKDNNLMIGLFRSYLSQIEEIMGRTDLEIYKAVKKEHEKDRAENLSANKYQEELGQEYFLEHNGEFSKYFMAMERRLRAGLKSTTFSIMDVSIQEHGCLNFRCVINPFATKTMTVAQGLECQWDERNHSQQVFYTEDSLWAINRELKEILPHATVREYHVNDDNVIRSFEVVDVSFSDIVTLFAKTEEPKDEDDF